MKPVTPEEVGAAKFAVLPPDVIDEWNQIIARCWNGSFARFTQSAIVEAIVRRTGVQRSDVFERRWLDIEPLYEQAGWEVEYDKPGYNETYEASFTFRKRGK